MNKKTYTILFTLVSTIINIIVTLAIILALAIVFTLLLNKVFHVQNGSVYMMVWMFCFIGGMIINLMLFAKVTNWVIKKFNLGDKLDPRFTGRKLPNGQKVAEDKKEKEVFKGNMPSSVLPKEEKDPWEEENHEPTATYTEILDASTLNNKEL